VLYVPSVWVHSGFAESVALVLAIAGALALLGGTALLRVMGLPMLLLLLAAPLPGTVIAAATGALKEWVSASAETLLYAGGYPVARSGVALTIGTYRLLVADACSGMNSLFGLSALGLFWLFIVPRLHRWQTIVLAVAIVPIAILANIARVVILVLITYYLGDEAGQGFLHDFAGAAMFGIAVCSLVALEGLFRIGGGRRTSACSSPASGHD
jgi:exosortase